MEGIDYVDDFLSDFFVNKCAWSSKNAIKENITGIKKFYKFMFEKGYITKENHKAFLAEVKNEKEAWIAGGNAGYQHLGQLFDEMMNDFDVLAPAHS